MGFIVYDGYFGFDSFWGGLVMRIGFNESVEVGDDNEFYSFFIIMYELKVFVFILLVFYLLFEYCVFLVLSCVYFFMLSLFFDIIIIYLFESID